MSAGIKVGGDQTFAGLIPCSKNRSGVLMRFAKMRLEEKCFTHKKSAYHHPTDDDRRSAIAERVYDRYGELSMTTLRA